MVKSFLVETYAPATTLVTDIEALVRHASAGTAVRYARSIFVPEDEVCFHLFEAAPSVESVEGILHSAGIVAQHIMEVRA